MIIIVILLVVIACAALYLILQSGERTAVLNRLELQNDKLANPNIPAQVVALAKAGRRVAALRAYCEATGCSLAVATARVNPLIPPEEHRYLGRIILSGAVAVTLLVGVVVVAIRS